MGSFLNKSGASLDDDLDDKPITPPKLLRFFLIGDNDVGKTSLSRYYCENVKAPPYRTHCVSTVGVDFQIRRITLQSTNLAIQIWDNYRSYNHTLHDHQMEGIDAFLLVFNVKPESWSPAVPLEKYISKIREKSQKPIYIIGNKTDLLEGDRSKYFDLSFDPWEKEKLIFLQILSPKNENIWSSLPRELILKILTTPPLFSTEERRLMCEEGSSHEISISRKAPLFFLSCLSGENADRTMDFIVQETAQRKGFLVNPPELKTQDPTENC